MKILVRLPNWLGDMVMSVGFLHQLPHFFPGADISLIAKKGIDELLEFFPATEHRFVFSKDIYGGICGLMKFGNQIRQTENYDLFFCLPDSFSAALMGKASGSARRIGFKKEWRQALLTDAYIKPGGLHRVEEYIKLVELFTRESAHEIQVRLQHSFQKKDQLVVNINSEASSRRLTKNKAVELLSMLRDKTDIKIMLIGAPKEKAFVDSVLGGMSNKENIENLAGKTTLLQLAEILASAKAMLSTDSGPAHLANALGTHTTVLFGAGNEKNTAPYNKELLGVIRLGELACEPCEKNVCMRFETPQCLERLDSNMIVQFVKMQLI